VKSRKGIVCHYASENTGGYGFWPLKHRISKIMKKSHLTNICRQQQGKRGVPDLYDSAIMLVKTHVEKMSETGLAIMFMKTQALISVCHYVNDNQASYTKAGFHFWRV
jgi:hypothetical protein